MWLHKKTVNDIVALSFKPQYLAYAHFKKIGGQVPYSMISCKQIPLDDLELEKQIIFNPTQIGKHLHCLLCEQSLCNADIRISMAGPTMFESIASDSEVPIEETYGTQLKNMVWQDMPIFQHSQLKNLTYICGISRELLFQYQLLAIKHKFNITCITTSNIALLSIYHALSPTDTRHNCPSLDDIASLIPTQFINRLCSHVPTTDNPLLMAELIGLCLSELNYENN